MNTNKQATRFACDLRRMALSTRAAPLAAQTPSAAADDDRDEHLGDRRSLETGLAESHKGVFICVHV